MDDLFKSMKISAAGMKAQGSRLRVISENVANANSLPKGPGDQPYRRKITVFKNELDRALGAKTVSADKVLFDKSDFQKKYDPGHPAADADGYVLMPNVNTLIEVMDMREAQRSYEANLNVIRSSKSMLSKMIGILQ